jgi:OHCU decarboxylase
MPKKLSVEEVNSMGQAEFVSRFGSLFEHSPWVAEGAWCGRPFDDLDSLHEAFVGAVQEASAERRVALIRAHPDLAGKAALAGGLTDESAREQASAGLDRLSSEEYEEFHRLNDAYREKFGLPFVVCVRDHTKQTIFSSAKRRLVHTQDEEIEAALGEISRISRLRLEDLVEE